MISIEKQLKKFTYLKQRKLFERLDVLPFVILQSLSLIIYASEGVHHIIKIVVCSLLILTQLIIFFSKFWSESLRATICYTKVADVNNASHVRVDVKSEKFHMINRTSICEIKRIPEMNLMILEFEKIFYHYNNEEKVFSKSKFDMKSKKLVDFLNQKPFEENEHFKSLKAIFGNNTMKIPIPSFFSLYKEHIVAPFFVFQLFCILLWVFDDYGLHSGMTLLMLCIFEATVVGQRIINLVTLRKMRVPPHLIYVYRNDQWKKISSADLIPGDIVSVLDGTSYDAVEENNEDEQGNVVLSFMKKLKEMKKKAEEQRRQRSVTTVLNRHKEKEPAPLTSDLLLLSGSAIVNEAMLTGESVPQIKDSVNKRDNEHEDYFDPKLKHKNSILFAGTKIVKVNPGFENAEKLPSYIKSPPPDKGAVCVVLKTGFSTSQGKLLRTVMFSSERTGGDSKEAFIFIFCLVFIALLAAYYVFKEGYEREGEVTYKLLLRCIIILTSVVPAELPIELSLAINNSLFFLQGKRIVCIEPFRIPYAGKIDFCCFDKTGTLTKDDFIMRGIVTDELATPTPAAGCHEDTMSILLGCNSLLQIQGKVVGDPIELAMFKSAGGSFQGDTISFSKSRAKILPIRRYPFDSVLKRMSVLVRFYSANFSGTHYERVLTKGAPEVIRDLLKEVPDNYDSVYNIYAKQGYRILALAYKNDEKLNVNTRREQAEKDLIFCGFAIVETPLKDDTNKYIKELIDAKYDCSIITGDHHLTTAKVSQDLNLGPKEILFMKISKTQQVEWENLDGKIIEKTSSHKEVEGISAKFTLGLTGKEMEKLENIDLADKFLFYKNIKLFCRVSPIQKDDIIKYLLKSGKHPSMCGDGSNDVGALKRATIGIALLNSEETEVEKGQPFSILSLEDEGQIKSGDVTAAAPFTSKGGSIKCIKYIFIQGRCTLIITFQMFKILALNCLLSAYSMSVLALKGIKFSDYQSTYMGFIVAFFFLMLSKAEPLKKLNQNKAPLTIFTLSSIISIVGQAICNLLSLYLVIQITEGFDPINIGTVKSFEDPFEPSLMNSIIFIFSILNQTTNFVVNYQGEPFMENLSKNKWLVRLVIGILICSTVVVLDLHPPLNEGLELLPFPDDMMYKVYFIAIMASNFLLCYFLENWKKIFNFYK